VSRGTALGRAYPATVTGTRIAHAALGACAAVAALGACRERAPAPPPAAVEPALVYQRGALFVRDDTTLTFVACGTVAERRVTLSPRSQLRDALAAVNGAVRDSAFVEFHADTTRGALHVRETLFATTLAESGRCDQPRAPFEWVAVGVEPFWRVTFDGAQLVLERPDPPRELVFEAATSDTRGALTTIVGTRTLDKVKELKLGILHEPCRDGMSDAWYPFRAEVRVGDRAYAGCARRQ
jgi:uncharacterized membrane protein